MTLLADMLKLIPRGKLREWGGGGRASNRTSFNGYRDDADMQFITRKKGRKLVKHVIVKEATPEFVVHDYEESDGNLWCLVLNTQYQGEESYNGIHVHFDKSGKASAVTNDGQAASEWGNHKQQIVDAVLKHLHVGDKYAFIKSMLEDMKRGAIHTVLMLINLSRHYGHDYPEFKAIEKSAAAHSHMKESVRGFRVSDMSHKNDELEFTVKHTEGRSDYTGVTVMINRSGNIEVFGGDRVSEWERQEHKQEIIDTVMDHIGLGDKDKFLKTVLTVMKHGSPYLARDLIRLSRKHGHDYPEFKAVEKSVKASSTFGMHSM